MVWMCSLFLLASFFWEVEACFKDNDFYCAQEWSFWFVLFWTCIFIIAAVIVITNLCTKKSRRVSNKGSTQNKSRQNGQANSNGQGVVNVRERRGTFLSKNNTISVSTKEDQISTKQVTPTPSNGTVTFPTSEKGESPRKHLADTGTPRRQPSAASITKVNPSELNLDCDSDGSEEYDDVDEAPGDVDAEKSHLSTKVSSIDDDINDF